MPSTLYNFTFSETFRWYLASREVGFRMASDSIVHIGDYKNSSSKCITSHPVHTTRHIPILYCVLFIGKDFIYNPNSIVKLLFAQLHCLCENCPAFVKFIRIKCVVWPYWLHFVVVENKPKLVRTLAPIEFWMLLWRVHRASHRNCTRFKHSTFSLQTHFHYRIKERFFPRH